MMTFYQRMFLFPLLIILSVNLPAADKDDSLLKKGWAEYGFQEYGRALKYFQKAEKSAGNKDDLCQALTGQAFCYHFGQKNSVSVDDYGKALLLYERCIAEAGENHKHRLFWNSMKAECLYRISVLDSDSGKFKQAEQLWSDIRKNGEATVVVQDAMLSRALMQTSNFSDETVSAFTSEMEEYLKRHSAEMRVSSQNKPSSMILAAIMANYIYNVYFWRGDYRKSVDYLIAYCKFGPTSFQYGATAYFKVARISELKLKDSKIAVEYYSKLYNEARSDNRAYYSLERAKALGAQLESGDKK